MDELTNEQEQSQACLSYAEREGRRRSQLNYKALEQIPIPEGLEERLSAKIDEWEQEETKQNAQHRRLLPRSLRYTAIAASVALVFGIGYHYLQLDEPVNLAEQDTYQDPVLAQQEAERALNLLAANLNKGMGHLEKAKALSDKAENTLNKQLKALK
jgi:hypothetical protein